MQAALRNYQDQQPSFGLPITKNDDILGSTTAITSDFDADIFADIVPQVQETAVTIDDDVIDLVVDMAVNDDPLRDILLGTTEDPSPKRTKTESSTVHKIKETLS